MKAKIKECFETSCKFNKNGKCIKEEIEVNCCYDYESKNPEKRLRHLDIPDSWSEIRKLQEKRIAKGNKNNDGA